MQGRQQRCSPKCENEKRKGADDTDGETPAGLGIAPARNEQSEVQKPEQTGPKDFWVVDKMSSGGAGQHRADREAGGEQDEAGDDEPAADPFQSLNGREQREHG